MEKMSFEEFRNSDERKLDDDLEALAYAIIGAAIEIHKHMGPGLPENSYRDALAHEFELRGIPFERELTVDILYKGKRVGKGQIDLLVDRRIIIELKVVENLLPLHRAQAISYLKITKLHLALIINFNVEVLRAGIRRVINS